MPLGNLVNLPKFRKNGHGTYQACCPAHNDKGPSLSIKECDDGRVLLHCFAGCSVEEVLSASAMTIHDIMPERIEFDGPARRIAAPFPAAHGIQTLWTEAMIVMDCARQLHAGKRLSKPGRDRLKLSMDKINEVSQLCVRT